MPPSPELRDASGNIGIIEVLQEMEAEHFSKTDSHIGIAGEIKVYLEGVGQRTEPGRRHGKLCHGKGRCRIPEKADIVCQQDFFAHAHNKAVDTFREIIEIFPAFLHLPCDRLILHDRARDELREHGNIGSVADPILLHLRISTVHVDRVGHGLEGEKGNADRQRNVQKRQIQAADRVDAADDEIRVFKKSKDSKVHEDRK